MTLRPPRTSILTGVFCIVAGALLISIDSMFGFAPLALGLTLLVVGLVTASRGRPRVRHTPVMRGPDDDPALTDEELVAQRTRWFEAYTAQKNVLAGASGGPYSCPCCGHVTLSERGGYEICDECNWEDDGQDEHDAHVVRGGPNGGLSLEDARAVYLRDGGTLLPHRPPADPA